MTVQEFMVCQVSEGTIHSLFRILFELWITWITCWHCLIHNVVMLLLLNMIDWYSKLSQWVDWIPMSCTLLSYVSIKRIVVSFGGLYFTSAHDAYTNDQMYVFCILKLAK